MNGALTPEMVIQDAERPESPLHVYFEWDDTEAAHAYRNLQACQLIRKINVTIKEAERRVVRVPVAYAEPPKQEYKRIEKIMGDDGAMNRALDYAKAKLVQAQRSFDELASAIDPVIHERINTGLTEAREAAEMI